MYPILLTKPIVIHSYGLCLALAFAGAIWLFARELKKSGGSEDLAYDVSFWVLLLSLLFARLLFVYVEWGRFANSPWTIINILGFKMSFPTILAVWKGGLVYYGGLFGGIVAVVGTSLYYRFSILEIGDYIAPGLIWGQLLGRVGCFLNGCCYGAPFTGFCGFVFPKADALPRHPTQLYSVLFFAIALPIALKLIPKRPFHGAIFFGYTFCYSFWRFAIEFLRDDPRGGFYFADTLPGALAKGFSISQCISVGLLAISVTVLLYQYLASKSRPTLNLKNN